MKLYTFQPLFVYQCLEDLGYYHPYFLYEHDNFLKEDIERGIWSFAKSYNWLKEQMIAKNIEYSISNDYMIWSWYHWNGANQPRPDKRFATVFDYNKEPYVLMELDIDEKRVLLSDYHAWHDVLNYSLLDVEDNVDKFEEKFIKDKRHISKEAYDQLSTSWHQIFDFEKCRQLLEIESYQQPIQATFFELFYTDVKKVHFFENKKCIKIINMND
jgi:hypothetical protein